MHNKSMELAKWAYEKACEKGYDCLTSQDWDDFKDCMVVAEKGIKSEYYYRIIEEMKEGGEYRMTPEMFKEHSAEWYRDMDISKGLRYYTEPIEHEKDVSKSEKARQKYHEDKSQENFDHFTKELVSDLTDMWGTLDNASRTVIKTRLQTLLTKMNA
jgi:hypothetical protein